MTPEATAASDAGLAAYERGDLVAVESAHIATTDLPEFASAARARMAQLDPLLDLASQPKPAPVPPKRRWWQGVATDGRATVRMARRIRAAV